MRKIYILMLGISLMLATTLVTESYAQGGPNKGDDKGPAQEPNGKVRAIQAGNSLSTDPGEEGVIGADIDCVGGIDYNNANDFHCFLVPDGIGIRTVD